MQTLVFLLVFSLTDTNVLIPARDTVIIDSVPFVEWSYSSLSTSAAMALWYWDFRNYGRLVDFFFDRWSQPDMEWHYNLPNVIREISIALGDTLDSLPPIWYLDTAIIHVANTINGYDFVSQRSPRGGHWNNWAFSWIKNEIDNGRPCVWYVFDYWYGLLNDFINHSLCVVGYIIAPSDTFIVVHNSCNEYEEIWPLRTYHNGIWSYNYVITVVPGDASSDNIFITFPTDSGIILQYNTSVDITYNSYGNESEYVKIWYASTYDSTEWTLIDSCAPNTGMYTWIVPEESLCARINLQAFNAMNSLEAADGSFYSFTTRPTGIAEKNRDIKRSKFNVSPNVFTNRLTIEFAIVTTPPISLDIYDISGRAIKNFSLPTAYSPGLIPRSGASLVPTVVSWDGKDNNGNRVRSGIYFVSLKQQNEIMTKKVVYLPIH